MKKLLPILLLVLFGFQAKSQQLPHPDSVKYLLTNMAIQIECTAAINDMYNFKFERAESMFGWMRRTYPNHPLPYFLYGLGYWWRIVPEVEDERYDAQFFAYMDTTIAVAEKIFENGKDNVEASFFLAAAYGFKGRLLSERKSWTKAAFAGKKALKYMEYFSDKGEFSPEFLFGDGLYNYYSVWIPENYPMLKPILIFFKKGEKALGLQQLETVAKEAFYAKVEAQYFLMRLYSADENEPLKAFQIANYLHETYPDNPYFHRYYARMLYTLGQYMTLERVALEIISRVEEGAPGYGATSGRYAGFFLGSLYKGANRDNSKVYFEKAVLFSEECNALESGYYLFSLSYLGRMARDAKNYGQALEYYNKILSNAGKKHATYAEAKQFKKDYKSLVKGN